MQEGTRGKCTKYVGKCGYGIAYCTKTDEDNRLFDEGGRKVEGGGRPAGQAAPEGGGFGRRSRHGGRRPPALRTVFRGLAGACGGRNSTGDCPIKNCGEGNYA